MEGGERRIHASAFGAAAGAYATHRPDHAEAAVGWALAPAPGRRCARAGGESGEHPASASARLRV